MGGSFQKDMLDDEWIIKARCRSLDSEMFFDKYEEDADLAKVVDGICLTCPVINDCFNHGTSNSEGGVWGGVYLVDGEISPMRNAHKSPEVWQELVDVVGPDA